jgi:hypothetical protein
MLILDGQSVCTACVIQPSAEYNVPPYLQIKPDMQMLPESCINDKKFDGSFDESFDGSFDEK